MVMKTAGESDLVFSRGSNSADRRAFGLLFDRVRSSEATAPPFSAPSASIPDGSIHRVRPTLKVPAPRPARVSWKVLGIALVLLVLSGCAAAPVAPPSATPIPAPIPPVMTEAARQELADQAQTALRDGFVASYPDVAVPTATRERFLSLEEIPSVIAACLTAAGVPAVASPEGGIETYVALGDEERHAIADYVCNTRFPSDPKNSVPLNESQITYLYQYQTTVLMPCLEAAHIRVDPPPTLESFMANYTGQGPATVTWQPYAHIDQGPPDQGIYKQCPQMPEHLRD
ncbi:hypothetical protein [Cryobacterium glucosi]|uniref:Lipoprotein n=1 Tax=Cryobacterium glucosi TaxID=1259175 RepID=A0ABY2IPZ9_9MICO|nr:hypothetical protein [Cryobacterium glucosi]TFC21847.1 hypothetical protein E3O46_06475 [Cryobacterium glucosi]